MTVKLREPNNVEVVFEKIYRKEKTEKGGGGGRGTGGRQTEKGALRKNVRTQMTNRSEKGRTIF